MGPRLSAAVVPPLSGILLPPFPSLTICNFEWFPGAFTKLSVPVASLSGWLVGGGLLHDGSLGKLGTRDVVT